jgi:3-hydroxyisobutyrate dehydrogenase-like beta-hydroxyacid dehydrogenase
MNNHLSLGFVGFGEAGFEMAKGLHSEGTIRIFVYDLKGHDPETAVWIKQRAREAGATYLELTEEVVRKADVIFSLVTPEACVAVAREVAPHLKPGQIYLDLTSSFPDDMKVIAALVEPTGAKFTDGAMMGPLPIYRHKVLIYVAGPHAQEAARTLNQLGMNLQPVGKEPGQASAIKLILSISTKGLGALLVEMLLAAHHYEVEEPVLSALNQFFIMGLEALVNRSVGSNAVHAGRRVREMESSVRLLQNLGIDPIMTKATAQRLRWSASLGLSEYFKGVSPEGYREVIKAWETIGLFPSRS